MGESIEPLMRIILPFQLLTTVSMLIARNYYWKHETVKSRRNKLFRFELSMIFLMLLVLIYCLPFFPGLASFGYPRLESEVVSPQRLLEILQAYNQAIVKTSVVLFMVIIEVILLIALAFRFTKSELENT